MVTHAIATFQPSNNAILSNALRGIESQLEAAARANVAQAGDGFTQSEIEAMTTIEELKLINGMDLAAVLLRGKLLKKIEDEALWSFHPGQYATLEEMARDQGISVSELSNVRDLCDVIFPYMENTLHMSVAETWEQIGKSNFRELTAVLKGIITGQASNSRSVQAAIEQQLNNTAATAASEGETLEDEELRQQTVSNLLHQGTVMTNRGLRTILRPERTASINANILNLEGNRFVFFQADEDQMTLLQRRMNGYMDPIEINLPADRRQRQIEAARIEAIRNFLSLLE